MPASMLYTVAISTNVEQQVIGPNPRRMRIRFYTSPSTITYIRPNPLGNVLGGMSTSTTGMPIELSYHEHGDIVRGPWYAFAGGSVTMGIFETID